MAEPEKPLRFHWSLSQAGNTFRRAVATTEMSGRLSLEAQLDLCRRAEECGIDSMLMATGFTRPDPLLLSVILGQMTERVKFMVACRPGLLSPTTFVQQINTLSSLIGGRVYVNLVCGHTPRELAYYGDFLSHDERYARAGEFLAVARALWQDDGPVDFAGRYYQVEKAVVRTPFSGNGRAGPEIYLGGSSRQALELAARHASCLWRLAEPAAALAPEIAPLVASGTEVGLLVSLLVRPTRDEALAAADALVARFGDETREVHRDFARRSDSEGFRAVYARGEQGQAWLSRCLWTGAVPYLGAPAIALLGAADEVVEAILEYRSIGVSQFLFMGWPDVEEMTIFGRDVLPRLREKGA